MFNQKHIINRLNSDIYYTLLNDNQQLLNLTVFTKKGQYGLKVNGIVTEG